jgi:TolA-binding protein
MSTSALTVQNAPRDPNELAKVGRFKLRRLAEELALFTDDASKGRFMAGSNQEMAQAIATHLTAMDQGNGQAGPAVAMPATAPPQTAVQRTPSNDATKAAAPAAAPVGAGAEALVQTVGQANALINELSGKVVELEGVISEQTEALSELAQAVRGNTRLGAIQTALCLTLAEEVTGAGRKEILEAAISDQESVAALAAELNGEDDDEGKE